MIFYLFIYIQEGIDRYGPDKDPVSSDYMPSGQSVPDIEFVITNTSGIGISQHVRLTPSTVKENR